MVFPVLSVPTGWLFRKHRSGSLRLRNSDRSSVVSLHIRRLLRVCVLGALTHSPIKAKIFTRLHENAAATLRVTRHGLAKGRAR